jgi:hypothetical protein
MSRARRALLPLGLLLGAACAPAGDPDGMGAAERRRYYAAYDASRTPAQWDSVRRAAAATPAAPAPNAAPAPGAPAAPRGVAFRLRNRAPWPARVEVADNVLDFAPFETRHVQFPPGTRVHAYDARRPDGRGRLLFTVTPADEGRAFSARG